MSLPRELLETAQYLARRKADRQTPADLRRAVSTAYYALFHLLVGDAVGRMTTDEGDRADLARGFEHRDMKKACHGVLAQSLPFPLPLLLGLPLGPELPSVATAFVKLQDERHLADYDLGRTFQREEVRDIVGSAASAFQAWDAVRTTPAAQAFLALLFLGVKTVKTR